MFHLAAIVLFAILCSVACAQKPPAFQLKPEQMDQIRAKTSSLNALLHQLEAKHQDAALLSDVSVYAKAGEMLLEFPDQIFTQKHLDHAFEVLDRGSEQARQLLDGHLPSANLHKQIRAYRSAIDGSLQPYGITLPANYDPTKPSRLYVNLHGRQNQVTETEFLSSFPNSGPGKPAVADNGQIQLDVYGRHNSVGYHWAGEADVFEALADVQKHFKIDDKRIALRGFSMGGEGAWHLALHYPDRWVAAEIGAGTISRRVEADPSLPLYQQAALRIWENMPEWALNIFNLPLAGHDGDGDPQTCCLPRVAPGTPNHGQLESSLHTRAQLEKEGFPSVGDPDFYHSQGTPGIFLISQKTGHGTSPLVRERLDAFLKEWVDKGQSSPDHLRFVTWTTRYNRDYWLSIDALGKSYERAEVDATRNGEKYSISTKNITRLTLREAVAARNISIDGQMLTVQPQPQLTLEKVGTAWKQAKPEWPGLHKTHALQGPIDDAFLEPFLLVRPTGKPWNEAVNQQALATLAKFDKLWARNFRGHPFVKDDKDVTEADLSNFHVILFGDPGSNSLIAKVTPKLPIKWTKQSLTIAGQTVLSKDNYPALIYPNPLRPSKYVVLNTGLTIPESDYSSDYGMPQWGDYAIVKNGAAVKAGLFDEQWRVR